MHTSHIQTHAHTLSYGDRYLQECNTSIVDQYVQAPVVLLEKIPQLDNAAVVSDVQLVELSPQTYLLQIFNRSSAPDHVPG